MKRTRSVTHKLDFDDMKLTLRALESYRDQFDECAKNAEKIGDHERAAKNRRIFDRVNRLCLAFADPESIEIAT